MCILATIALQTTLALSSLGSSGCKTCTVPGENNSVSSKLAYTEPTAAKNARDARIANGDDTPERLSADTARGRGRVTGEARTFDNDGLSVFDSTINLRSTVSFTVTIADFPTAIPLSVVTLRMDVPTKGGKQSLSDLHAKVCEDVLVQGDAGTQNQSVCGDVTGSIDFQPSGNGNFDADLTLTNATPASDSPTLAGTTHLHHDAYEETSACPDLGKTPLAPE